MSLKRILNDVAGEIRVEEYGERNLRRRIEPEFSG